ncbi:MAG: ornithine cyclodeaminase family protein, partial [Gemmatimonadetes bacterium]|nr:ornithine cyclodeaminase family protein [Gemmatimonadota bacterium]
MPEIFNREQIERALQRIDVTAAIEEGFIAYSEGKVVVPPVGELVFDDPPGDVHIKYGYIKNDDYFVIKVASGFYDNVKLGLPPADGLMLVFSQKTAQLECILLDECHLTNVRTAAAGAVVAKYLAPRKVERIGVFGAGVQGKMQVEALLPIVDCREVVVWGTGEEELEAYREAMSGHGLEIQTTVTCDEIAATCNLIVTATPSHTPLLRA